MKCKRYVHFSIIDPNLSCVTLAYNLMLWILHLCVICDMNINLDYIIVLLHENPLYMFNFWMKLMKLVSFNCSGNLYLSLRKVVQRIGSVVVIWVLDNEQLTKWLSHFMDNQRLKSLQ